MTADGRAGRSGNRRLVLVRHGRTAWNAERRFQGHADVELDEVGHAEAAAVAPHLASFAPELLWSSDLARARQTAAYAEKETGLEARLDPRLREFDVGERTGLAFDESMLRFPGRADGELVPVAGAETPDDVLARMMPAYDELVATLAPGETAVVVTHGACMRLAAATLLGWPPAVRDTVRGLGNGASAVLEESSDGFRLQSWNVPPDFAGPGRAR